MHNYKNEINSVPIIKYVKDVNHTKCSPADLDVWTAIILKIKRKIFSYHIYIKRKYIGGKTKEIFIR